MGNGTRFSWRFTGQSYKVFLPFSPVSLTELCSFWYGLKDLFTLHKLATKVVLDMGHWDDWNNMGNEDDWDYLNDQDDLQDKDE